MTKLLRNDLINLLSSAKTGTTYKITLPVEIVYVKRENGMWTPELDDMKLVVLSFKSGDFAELIDIPHSFNE